MLAQRVITAGVGIPVIVALILIGDAPYTAAAALILVIAALEFFAATDPEEAPVLAGRARLQRLAPPLHQQRFPALLGAAAVALIVVAADSGYDEWTGAFAASIAAVFLYLVLRADPQTGLRDWVWVVSGVAYIGFLGSHLVLLRGLDADGDWVILAVFATFGADTAAYFVGRTFGRIHITPAISPGKTLEGTIAGVVGGLASAIALNWITGLDAGAADIIPLGVLIPAGAIAGDLAESLIKRGVGVKDTSELIPGHGGFLDRIDAVLFTTPLVYYFVIWAIE